MDESFAIIPLLFTLVFAGVGLLAFAFWIWTLVDCITKEPSESTDKIMWVLIIVLLSWLGALIYLLVRRPQRIKQFGK
jgi:uncharacterized membrane protein